MDYEKRLQDIKKFYSLLGNLEEKIGSKRTLADCTGRMDWPERGVYFFFEPGEYRATSGEGLRVTRVGTHGLKTGSSSTLWKRLRQHRGTLSGSRPGGGNHRGSVFRLHVGTALINRDDWQDETAAHWGIDSSASSEIRDEEYPLEKAVSDYIRKMPFLWLDILDEPGPDSLRGFVEQNAIALLSNFGAGNKSIDPPSKNWLGNWAASTAISNSGLWNVNHVSDKIHPDFIGIFGNLIKRSSI
jgi:hypothetical protein